MYTMTPFEKKHFDLLNAFHDFENDFFADKTVIKIRKWV